MFFWFIALGLLNSLLIINIFNIYRSGKYANYVHSLCAAVILHNVVVICECFDFFYLIKTTRPMHIQITMQKQRKTEKVNTWKCVTGSSGRAYTVCLPATSVTCQIKIENKGDMRLWDVKIILDTEKSYISSILWCWP